MAESTNQDTDSFAGDNRHIPHILARNSEDLRERVANLVRVVQLDTKRDPEGELRVRAGGAGRRIKAALVEVDREHERLTREQIGTCSDGVDMDRYSRIVDATLAWGHILRRITCSEWPSSRGDLKALRCQRGGTLAPGALLDWLGEIQSVHELLEAALEPAPARNPTLGRLELVPATLGSPILSERDLQVYEDYLLEPSKSPAEYPLPKGGFGLQRAWFADAATSAPTPSLRDLAARAADSLSPSGGKPLTREEYQELLDGLDPGTVEWRRQHQRNLRYLAERGPHHLRQPARDELRRVAERGPYLTTSDLAVELAERERRREAVNALAESVRVALERVEHFAEVGAADTRQPDPLHTPRVLGGGAAQRHGRARRAFAEAMVDLERALEDAGLHVDVDHRSRVKDAIEVWNATARKLPADHEFRADEKVAQEEIRAEHRVRELLSIVLRGLLTASVPHSSAGTPGSSEQTGPAGPTGEGEPGEYLVGLDQAAALAGRSKKTLERMKKNGLLPEPYRVGGEGEADLWRWGDLRPAIEPKARRILPERFPGHPE